MTQTVLHAIVRLAAALDAENAALRTMDLPAAAALVAEKQAASAAFDAARNGGPAASTAPLRDAAARLASLADENRRLLERAIAVQSRVLGIVVGAARTAHPVSRYGRSGAYAAPPPMRWALSARA